MMRVFEKSDIDALLKGFGREALIWRQQSHPNLLPFYGLYYFQRRLCLVSPWMDNRHIRAFLKKEMYCTDCLLSLILDVAHGLEHLHSKGVVHGDLKGDNIFVTASCRACLILDVAHGLEHLHSKGVVHGDLKGVYALANSPSASFYSYTGQHLRDRFVQGVFGRPCSQTHPSVHKGVLRVTRPLSCTEEGQNDHLTDIYAFACLVYELLTGKAPFPELYTDVAVAMAVIEGRRPTHPSSCSGTSSLDALWNLLQNCWEEKPENRPTASQLVERLKGDDIQAIAVESTLDWDDTFTSKFHRLFLGERPFPSVIEFERVVYGSGQFK
ncbi:kinase-like domain-containing protein [Mycena olivaceomarginata]|nr:kinase-like domain-containing protein [Mycena olivaceomarginata]